MARRGDVGHLFIGRLNKNTRIRDLEEIFEPYGRLTRCDIKYGPDMAYGFVDFEDRRDAQLEYPCFNISIPPIVRFQTASFQNPPNQMPFVPAGGAGFL